MAVEPPPKAKPVASEDGSYWLPAYDKQGWPREPPTGGDIESQKIRFCGFSKRCRIDVGGCASDGVSKKNVGEDKAGGGLASDVAKDDGGKNMAKDTDTSATDQAEDDESWGRWTPFGKMT